MSAQQIHEEKETLVVDINIPGHEERTTTALFTHSKKALLARDGARCYVCNRTAMQSGHPLESHHHPIERSMTNMIDWQAFSEDCKAGKWGVHAQTFDWANFFEGATLEHITVPAVEKEAEYTATFLTPVDPLLFVDDQLANGVILCKLHHTGKDAGIHDMPYPLWIAQKYGKEGYNFSTIEIIHHAV